tara:strand:+ start:146 stop:1639 length:1494 start_codon:yes stop_codon:yes gene_type:complete
MSKVIQGLSKKERKKLVKEIYNKINIEVGEVEEKIKEASPLYNYWESDGNKSILDDLLIKEDRFKKDADDLVRRDPSICENLWREHMTIIWKKEKAAEYGLTDVFDDIKDSRRWIVTIIKFFNTKTKIRVLQLVIDNKMMGLETLTRFKQALYNACDSLKDEDGFKLTDLCMDNDVETLSSILNKEIESNANNVEKSIKEHIRDDERKKLKEMIDIGDPFYVYRGFLVEQDEYVRMGKKDEGSDYWKQNAGKGLSYSIDEDVAGYFCYWNLTWDEKGNLRDREYSKASSLPPSIVSKEEYIKYEGEIVSKRIDKVGKKPIVCKFLCDPKMIKGYSFDLGEGEINLYPDDLAVIRYEIVSGYKIGEYVWNKIQKDREFIWDMKQSFNPNGIAALSVDTEDGGKEIIFADGKKINERIKEYKEKVLSGDKLTMNNMRDANLYDIWKEFAVELPDDIDPVLLTKQLYWILTNPYKIEPKFKQGNVIKRSYQAVQHYLGYS